MSDRRSRVAHVEDADESGDVIEGTERYAESVYDPSLASPSKEREIPNSGRTRKPRTRRDSISPGTSGLTDSDSTAHPRGESLRSSRDQERRYAKDKKAMVPSGYRPPVHHANTTGSVPREAAYYGVSPGTTSMPSSRPRAQTSRHPSHHTGSRPPAANFRWYQSQAQSLPPPPPQQPVTGPYPPAGAWVAPAPYPRPPPSPSPVVSQSPNDYYSRLESRFGSDSRPRSSMGFRAGSIGFDEYAEPGDMVARRPSQRRQSISRNDERVSMGPPPRPATARPVSLAIRPPPGTPARRGARTFEDDDLTGDSDLFCDISPRIQPPYEPRTQPIPMRPRQRSRSRHRSSSIYDAPNFRTEIAVARGGRPSSYYGRSSSSGSYEDKLRQASLYQDDVAGSNGLQLTAESLRKAGRHAGGSRSSTRSSESRDESDFRQSNTTRTTRSSAPGEEDMTIRVKGNAVLDFGGAKMRCQDGAEINISRGGPTGPPGQWPGSDRSSSYMGQDDRRTRIDHRERPPPRHRNSSQAGYGRSALPPPPLSYEIAGSPGGGYFPSPTSYDIPPYPTYPSVFPRPDGYF